MSQGEQSSPGELIPASSSEVARRSKDLVARGLAELDLSGAWRCRATLCGDTGPIEYLAVSRDGKLLASLGQYGNVRLWGLPEGSLVGAPEAHIYWVRCLAMNPDNRLLLSGGYYGAVQLWRLPGGELLKTLEGHQDKVGCLAVSPDGKLLVTGSEDRTLRLWGLPEGMPIRTLEGHTEPVGCLAMSADGRPLGRRISQAR